MITVTFQFENVAAAQQFLEAVNDGPKPEFEVVIDTAAVTKRERKPRSDAGQPRGPYKRKDEDSPVEAAATAPQAETPPAAVPEAAAAPAPATVELSIADVRVAMTGRSTEKNIALLKKFGYAKSSDLPKEKYAEFIAACKRGE